MQRPFNLNIGLGATAFVKGMAGNGIDGIGTYTKNLHLSLLDANASVKAYSHRGGYSNLNDKKIASLSSFRPQLISSLMFKTAFRDERRLYDEIDLFHSLDHYIPRLHRVPTIATIHDVIPLSHAHWFRPIHRAYHHLLKKSMRWPDRIITVSEYSKREIVRLLGVSPDLISVAYNGVAKEWSVVQPKSVVEKIRIKHSIKGEYCVMIGTVHERKNFGLVLDAFMKLKPSLRTNVTLVGVGQFASTASDLTKKIKLAEENGQLKWLSQLENDELIPLVQGANCLLFPSLAEGFGLPIVEAFAAGCPVVASNTTAIPEIAGDAAVLLDPRSIDDWVDGITAMLEDRGLQKTCKKMGRMRAKMFGWETTANETLKAYKLLMH